MSTEHTSGVGDDNYDIDDMKAKDPRTDKKINNNSKSSRLVSLSRRQWFQTTTTTAAAGFLAWSGTSDTATAATTGPASVMGSVVDRMDPMVSAPVGDGSPVVTAARSSTSSVIAVDEAAGAAAPSSSTIITATNTRVPSTVTAACDPSVSVWKLPSRNDNDNLRSTPRMLYLLGTAHISEQSAQLAGDLVQQVHPNAVFVELDLRRIMGGGGGGGGGGRRPTNDNTREGINPGLVRLDGTGAESLSSILPDRLYLKPAQQQDQQQPQSKESNLSSRQTRIVIPRVEIPPQMMATSNSATGTTTSFVEGSSSSSSSSLGLPPPPPRLPPPSLDDPTAIESSKKSGGLFSGRGGSSSGGGGWFRNLGAAVVGKAIKSMYSSLGQAGFQPGQEFVAAMNAGQDMGADIVLGDQDVQVTMQRLSSALAVTDWNKLLATDSELQDSMNELLMGSRSTSTSNGEQSRTTTTTSPSSIISTSIQQQQQTPEERQLAMKQELTNFVETLKSRDRLRIVMGQLQQVAPALVQVMLTERDAYMAAGMNELEEYSIITAVVGIAHQDGIERNLQAMGWQPVPVTC